MMNAPAATDPPHAERHRPQLVVGIGASAGGVQALKAFFGQTPRHAGITYVVILHLSPDYDSRLAEVLQVTAPIPVTKVTERVRVEVDHVYVLPPNKTLEIYDDHLVVSDVTRVEQRRAPVDRFFRTLADAYGARAAAVVLSGTGPDGSAGIKRVKEHGGLTIAQDPDEAEYGDMPRNAIATGLVDVVLRIEEMTRRIVAYTERLESELIEMDAAVAATPRDPEPIREVLTLLRVRTGHDFSNYKPATVQRRVRRRINLRGLPSVGSYARVIREEPDEAVALMRELLISVTNFFRDPAAFEVLSAHVVPRIFAGRGPSDQVRAWIPGCATGEEAYSIAMILAEHAARSADQPSIQVFATDLDEHAIATAREGLYTEAEIADVSDERLQRFFEREARGYRVRRELRELLLFAQHNVIQDPPFSHLDLISCRNLLIYLNRSIQERLLETFHFALRPGGYLFLGTSESPDGANHLFSTFDKNAHVYESRTVATRVALPVPSPIVVPPSRTPTRAVEGSLGERISPAELHQRLLEQYAPPSLVVTEEHSIVHMSEHVGRYLQMPGGEPTRDLMRMIRPELRSDLRVALHEAARQKAGVTVRAQRVPLGDRTCDVTISVRPALSERAPRGFFLIVLDDAESAPPAQPTLQVPARGDSASAQLEEELARIKGQLRVTIEQYETQVEEARASNEELQAMNEELRSSAEELETSKEELESVNEELTTVNQELKLKIEELGITNNNLQNLINSSDVGTIFLDRTLRVKLSTPAARSIFNLRPGDTGRPLSDITSRVRYERLYDDAQDVLHHLHTVDREVETHEGRWYLMRLRPYRTTDDRIDGVVITFQDITARRNAERQVRASEQRLRQLLDSAHDYAIFTLTPDGVIDSWNSGAERTFGYTAEEIVGRSGDILFTPEDRAAGVPAAEMARARIDGRALDERYHLRKSGERFYCSGVTTPLDTSAGTGFAKIARDLTEQRRAADALKEARANLENAVEERTRALQAEIAERAAAQEQATNLLRKVVTSQEDERARVARDLHDQLGQQLTALRLSLERLADRHKGDEQVARAVALAAGIDSDLGFLAWELRPAILDDLGLRSALPQYVREWSEHYNVVAEYRSTGFQPGDLSHEAEVAFYRVAQEALTNVAKHAHASRVDVMLESRDGSVILVVEDNGQGFDPAAAEIGERGIGLVGMRERAALVGATLQIESSPGDGTSIFLRCAAHGKSH